MTRILLIEDEEDLGAALEYQLVRDGFDVQRETDGLRGLKRFQEQGADLILLDLMLPGMTGEDLCREVRRSSSVPIVMLTAKDQEVDKVVGLEIGADDYVTKPFSTRELVARMKALLRRAKTTATSSQGAVFEAAGIRLDIERHEVSVRGVQVHLPRREFELLELLMTNEGRVLTREQLIDEIWGPDYFGDTRTLDVHIKRLRSKCEEDPHRPKHLLTIRGLGYKFVP